MTQLMHADVFFFIAAIGTAMVSLAACVALGYLIAILRDVRDITARARSTLRAIERFRFLWDKHKK